MAKHYSQEQLRTIGTQCADALMPAAIMQRMFLYEMRRETEAEKLFHDQIFRLARVEQEASSKQQAVDNHDSRIKRLEESLVILQADRSTKVLASTVSTLAARMVAVEKQTDSVKDVVTVVQTRADTIEQSSLVSLKIQLASTVERVTNSDNELSALCLERDHLKLALHSACERVSKLEDLVRAVTLQQVSTTSAGTTGLPTTHLPVNTIDRRALELVVPKGSPLVKQESHKPVRKASGRSGASGNGLWASIHANNSTINFHF